MMLSVESVKNIINNNNNKCIYRAFKNNTIIIENHEIIVKNKTTYKNQTNTLRIIHSREQVGLQL